MATEKNLKKLTIHKLKKKTYNALAEKPVDELVMLTDVGGQVAEITEASADYVGEIVQYVGETNDTYTNGFFYKCTETDGVYSWTQVNVQGGGASLPDLLNKATRESSIKIIDAKNADVESDLSGVDKVVLGYKATGAGLSSVVAIGAWSSAGGDCSVAVGKTATTKADFGIAIGPWAYAKARKSIQLGSGDNYDANTFKISNDNGNFEMMSADGTIPTDRYTTTPTTAGTYVPKLTIAEDGTVTREWGTESGGAGGDYLLKTDAAATYLPLSGGSIQYLTLTNNANYIGFKLSGSYKVSMRPLNPEMLTTTAGLGLSETILSFGWDDWSARFRLLLDTGTQKLFPAADNSFSLGLSERRWVNIYTYKLNNGADLIVPTEGGTLARIEDINAAVGDISTALTAILGE